MSVFGVSAGVCASAAVASSTKIGERVRFMASEATIPRDIRRLNLPRQKALVERLFHRIRPGTWESFPLETPIERGHVHGVLIFLVDPVRQLLPEARILLQQLANPELLGDRTLPVRTPLHGLYLPFQKVLKQPRLAALHCAPFAFG